MGKVTRREFLRSAAPGAALAAGALLGGGLLATRCVLGAPGTRADGRFVFVILRGALDGLSAVPPYADPAYAALRAQIAVPPPGAPQGGTRLDGTFALHPALGFMAERYAARELLVMHAIATPYRERSHFDGQDVLESGMPVPHAADSGWLNRALAARGADGKSAGIALGSNVPLVMRGPADVASWSPSRLAGLREDTLQRLADLYATDPVLGVRLADALRSDAIAAAARRDGDEPAAMGTAAGAMPAAPAATPGGAARFGETLRAAAAFLARADGPRVAVLETTGWDTHANEGGAEGPLAQRLGALDAGLREFSGALGPAWQRTTVLLATEFGRTAAGNGTRGTDHGTGAAAFLVGGAVAGGRVLADWPGLAPGALLDGRDLRPTLDLRAVLKGVLHDHLQVADASLDAQVFPDSARVRRLEGLTRA